MENSENGIDEKTANDLIEAFEEHKKSTRIFSDAIEKRIENIVFRHRKN